MQMEIGDQVEKENVDIDDNSEKTFDEAEFQEAEYPKANPSFLSSCLFVACFPVSILRSCYSLDVQTENVITRWGAYESTEKRSGLHFWNCWGGERRVVNKSQRTKELPNTKVIDATGTPLILSGIIVYQVVISARSVLEVENVERFVSDQGQLVLKRIIGMFPYESLDDNKDQKRIPTLKSHPKVVCEKLVKSLQRRVIKAGIRILSFDLNEISYSPEISAGMLKKQLASAVIASKRLIVQGAVDIATQAVVNVEEKGFQLDRHERAQMVSNLLTVLTSEVSVNPNLPLKDFSVNVNP